MMGLKLYQVDAFTKDLFGGNPAGVCLVDAHVFKSDALLLNIAAEMNLSETAFLSRTGESRYDLRWFTPAGEVPLCGHATLSASHILWETGAEKTDAVIQYSTLSGILAASRKGDAVELDFPSYEITPCSIDSSLCEALGIEPVFTGSSGSIIFIEASDADDVRSLSPDFYALKDLGDRAYIVTAASDASDCDFVSRFFAPAQGIDEDPVTGSAHCYLAPYWARKLSKTRLNAYQASARGGMLECELLPGRVLIRGFARTVFEIDMRIEL